MTAAFEAHAAHKLVLGVIHLPPLPGTPFYASGTLDELLEGAVASARALEQGGADGCLLQTADRVYSTRDESDPARTGSMALIARRVVEETSPAFRVGVQIMRNALRASLAVAKVCGGGYIRAGAIVGATMSTHGIVQPDALGLMAYRASLDAYEVGIVADIASMHYEWWGSHQTVGEVARAARGVGADAVAVCHRNEDTALAMIESVRCEAPDAPVLLAGYTNHDNARRLLTAADGAFVAGCIESDRPGNGIDPARVAAYVELVRAVER